MQMVFQFASRQEGHLRFPEHITASLAAPPRSSDRDYDDADARDREFTERYSPQLR